MSHPHTSSSLPEAYPSLGELERYVRGELSPNEEARMHTFLEKDPFLADAAEGLKHIKDPKQLRRRLQYLRRRNERLLMPDAKAERNSSKRLSRVRPKLMPQMMMSIAAGLGLLILAVGLIRELRTDKSALEQAVPMSEPIAEGDLPEQLIVGPVAEEEDTASEKEPQLLSEARSTRAKPAAEEGPQDLAPLVQPAPTSLDPQEELPRGEAPLALADRVEEEEPQASSGDMDDERLQMELAQNQARQERMGMEETDIKRARTESPRTGYPAPSPAQYAREQTADASLDKLSASEDDLIVAESSSQDHNARLAKGIELYRNQQLTPALKEFKKVLDEAPQDPLANFYAGDIEYRKGRTRQAISYLNRIAGQEDENLYDRARWVLAQAYVAEGDSLTGKTVLNELASRKGFYQEAARNMLKQWDKK